MKRKSRILCLILCFSFIISAFGIYSFASDASPRALDFKSADASASIIPARGGVVPGDLNGDGEINLKDSLLLRKLCAGILCDGDARAADVNADGSVSAADAAALRSHLSGDESFAICTDSVTVSYSEENLAAEIIVKFDEARFEIALDGTVASQKYPFLVLSYILPETKNTACVLSFGGESCAIELRADGVRHSTVIDIRGFSSSFDSVQVSVSLEKGEVLYLDSVFFTATQGEARSVAASRENGEPETRLYSMIFDSAEESSRVKAANNATVGYNTTQNAAALTVTGGDPQTNLNFEDASLSADEYKYIVITYMVPTSASSSASKTELFLCAGDTTGATAGRSTTFEPIKDGKYHALIIPLGSLDFWNGIIHMIRLDFFSDCRAGDTMYLDSFALTATKSEATAFAKEREALRGVSTGAGTKHEGYVKADGKDTPVTYYDAASLSDDGRATFSGQMTVVFQGGITDFNRFRIEYSTNSIIRAIAYYSVDGTEKTDEFFLENTAGADNTFTSLILGYFDGAYASKLTMIEFYTINTSSSSINLKALSGESYALYAQGTHYLENDSYKLGVDLLMGGGINYIEYYNDGNPNYNNLLNNYDVGRLIQQSYYGLDKPPYQMGYWTDRAWGYNPVQGGDKLNNISRVVDFEFISDSEIYVKARPMDWGQVNQATPSYMENVYTLTEDYIKVDNRFVDFSGYDHSKGSATWCWQELPAFYTISALNNFTYYNGSSPWTGDNSGLITRSDLVFWGQVNNQAFELRSTSEFWSAWTDNSGFGIGLYVPGVYTYHAGKFMYNGSADPTNEATNYVAPRKYLYLVSGKPLEYSYLVTAGSLGEIRETFRQNRSLINNSVLERYN